MALPRPCRPSPSAATPGWRASLGTQLFNVIGLLPEGNLPSALAALYTKRTIPFCDLQVTVRTDPGSLPTGHPPLSTNSISLTKVTEVVLCVTLHNPVAMVCIGMPFPWYHEQLCDTFYIHGAYNLGNLFWETTAFQRHSARHVF